MKTLGARAATAAAIITFGAAPAAHADEETVLEEVLQILLDEGRIGEDRYRELLDRHRQEQRSAEATPQVSAGHQAEPRGWGVQWKNGLRIERNDGHHKLRIGGRIMNDWALIHQEDGLVHKSRNSEYITGTEFRRARLFVSGTLFERVVFKTQYDFADGGPEFKDVWAGLVDLGPIDQVRVGHFKEPFGLEQLTSSKYITFLERSQASVFDPSRNTGIEFRKAVHDDRMTLALGGFRVTDDFGAGFGSSEDYDVATRITGLPVYRDDGQSLVHLGFGYFHGFREMPSVRFRERPEIHMADRLLNTGNIAGVEHIDGFGPEFAWVCGPFSLQSEFKGLLLDRDSMSDLFLWGTYAEASYWLTGEHRPYKKSAGAFDRVEPANSFDPADGHWGAFQAALRYSYLDLNDENVFGGRESNVTAGLNWHLFANARVMVNYVYGRVRGQGDVNGAQTRLQLDF